MADRTRKKRPVAIVRGVGDVGSAIAWKLFHQGFCIIAHENRQPRTIRRKMAFCDALWEGESILEGLRAVRVERLVDVMKLARLQKAVALFSGDFNQLVENVCPDVIVDGRVQKFGKPERVKGLAQLSIGVGPGFVAGEHVDFVIESCWGEKLGNVLSEGQALSAIPEPPALNGIGWGRFVRADIAGRFQTRKQIGDMVTEGMKIGQLNTRDVIAPITGHLRGLLYPGLSVLKGEKICEIDPRGDQAHFDGLAERPNEIARGVWKTIETFFD